MHRAKRSVALRRVVIHPRIAPPRECSIHVGPASAEANGLAQPVNLQKKNTLCTLGALSASGLRNFFFLHRLIALYIDRSKAAHRHLDRRSL